MIKQVIARAAFCCALALLAACEGMPTAPVEEAAATKEAGYGRAFGRVRYFENGKELEWTVGLLRQEYFTLFVRSVGTGEIHYMDIPSGGAFWWPLRPGDYVALGFQRVRRGGATIWSTGRLAARFSVPQAGQAVYIGELRIDARRYEVLDRYEAALESARERIAAAKLEPVKGLLRFDSTRLGKYSRVSDVCSAAWELSCDAAYRGIRPLENSAWNYGVTADLTPLLAWQPSRSARVTYDVAVYESFEVTNPSGGTMARLRGSLVAYAEDLREPRYVPPPLAPGARYEWTVRLRDGDAVSTWSTTDFSLFAVVMATRYSGQYFGFQTPPAR